MRKDNEKTNEKIFEKVDKTRKAAMRDLSPYEKSYEHLPIYSVNATFATSLIKKCPFIS